MAAPHEPVARGYYSLASSGAGVKYSLPCSSGNAVETGAEQAPQARNQTRTVPAGVCTSAEHVRVQHSEDHGDVGDYQEDAHANRVQFEPLLGVGTTGDDAKLKQGVDNPAFDNRLSLCYTRSVKVIEERDANVWR